MMRSSRKRIVSSGLAGSIVLFAVAALGVATGDSSVKDKKVSIPSEQVIACVRTAVAAKPGNVLELEAENEAGKVICEVEILAEDKKTYEVSVDVATNAVIEIENDDDDDDDDKDDKDDDN